MTTLEELIDEQRRIDEALFPEVREDASYSYWGCALAGELGELLNLFKKLARKHPKDSLDKILQILAEEAADCLIYLLVFLDVLQQKISSSLVSTRVAMHLETWQPLDLTEKGCVIANNVGELCNIILTKSLTNEQRKKSLFRIIIDLIAYLHLLAGEMNFNVVEVTAKKQQKNWIRFQKSLE
ncbi:MAG: hypothetical protein ACFFCQ_07630 [Promethearchaeota archaeon]